MNICLKTNPNIRREKQMPVKVLKPLAMRKNGDKFTLKKEVFLF